MARMDECLIEWRDALVRQETDDLIWVIFTPESSLFLSPNIPVLF